MGAGLRHLLMVAQNGNHREMTLKITNVIGSPRTQGNCALVAGALVAALSQQASSVKTYELNKLAYHGCQACMSCKTTSDSCVTADDLSPLLEDIGQSDVLVVSTPIYFGEISAQLKGLVDRLFSYLPPDYRTSPKASRLPAGKKLVLIVTQGNPDEKVFGDIAKRYENMFSRLGFAEDYPIRVCGVGREAIPEVSEQTLALTKEVAGKILAGL